jgi:GTP-binding protein Era
MNPPGGQVILVDTPGLPGVSSAVNESLEKEALRGVESSDVVLAITDPAGSRRKEEEEKMLRIVEGSTRPALLALNKVDLITPDDSLPLIARYLETGLFREIIPVSAVRGTNIDRLSASLVASVPVSPPLFPRDIVSDQPERDFFGEMVREKIFRSVHQELPYATAVVVESVEEDEETGFYRVAATIHVERQSQKGILIGQGGKVLKKIGMEARKDMERLTGGKVFLSLWVKVRKNWTRDPQSLREFGFD